jgi:hypothetical protein
MCGRLRVGKNFLHARRLVGDRPFGAVGKYELKLAPWATRLTRPLLATAPVRAKNQHTAAFLPGQFRSP